MELEVAIDSVCTAILVAARYTYMYSSTMYLQSPAVSSAAAAAPQNPKPTTQSYLHTVTVTVNLWGLNRAHASLKLIRRSQIKLKIQQELRSQESQESGVDNRSTVYSSSRNV